MFAEIRGLNEECGVFGIWGHPSASSLTYFGLHSLQHRGQEGAGIVSLTDEGRLIGHRDLQGRFEYNVKLMEKSRGK